MGVFRGSLPAGGIFLDGILHEGEISTREIFLGENFQGVFQPTANF